MYDRKKITLFVLLIATVFLGGISLFLATQINNNQSPDDSQAGNGVCSPKYSGVATSCSSKTDQASCIEESALINANSCCQIGGTNNTCNKKTGSGVPSYCAGVQCIDRDAFNCGEGTIPLSGACNWTATAVCDTTQACLGGSTRITSAGANQCKCLCPGGNVVNPGASCVAQTTCSATSGDTTCQGRLPGAACQLPGGGNGACSGSAGNACTCLSTGGTNTGGSASCIEQGEEISHGNTACINGTNYTCSNGTATPGSSCGGGGDQGGGDQGGGDTGSTCTPSNPQKAKFIGPGRDAVLNTATVTLQWQRNGTFGVACPTNDNKYRVRLLAIGLNETCPTSSLDIPNLPGQIEPGTSDEGTFNYQINVQDDTKYCWAIRKNNGDTVADTAVRSFTVNIEETNPTTGGGGDDGTGTTTSEPVEPATTGNNATTTTGGTVTGSIAGANTALPETAIISDELDPIILGMILVIIGLTLYKFDFGRKTEVE